MLNTLAASPMEHVIDHPLMGWYVSNYTLMLVLAGIVTAAILIPAARRIQTGQNRSLDDFRSEGILANLVESVCIYLRDEVFKPVLRDQADRFTPILWTLFWFILVNNLLGLIPLIDFTKGLASLAMGERWIQETHFHGLGGTATQSIWVTGALAGAAFIWWNTIALMKDWKGWFAHMTAGAPWYMWPIMIPVEILGMIVKPAALAIRLFANMTGGHILLAVMLGFIVAMIDALGPVGYGMALIPFVGSVLINILEILVGFIQAFVFVFLTTLFLGQLVVHEHEEEHEDHPTDHLPHATAEGVDQTKSVPLGASNAAGQV
ncbi:MAG: F0F1 ATP synthase subunit A [Phycisphaeraceae bacterium]